MGKSLVSCFFDSQCVCTNMHIPGGPKKRPEISHGLMQQTKWNESAEKHVGIEYVYEF